MAIPIRKAMGVLAIVALLSGALLGAGCGGSGSDDGSERAVKWTVDRPLGPREVRLSATQRACVVPPPPFERPLIDYSGNQVFIELRFAPEESEGEHKGCLLQLFGAFKVITLERDLDELVLFDASTDPPEQRWPRPK